MTIWSRQIRLGHRLARLIVLLLVVTSAASGAEPTKLDSLKVGGKVYRKITILGTSETDLYFRHERGIANVKMKYLEPEMQKRFDFDPKAAEEAERRQLEEDAAYYETVSIQLTERAQQSIKAAAEAAASSEDSLADPIADQSPVNRPGPKLEVGKWLGETPDTEGKAVLLFFWTTWSVPSRKAIPEMNNYHKRFRDKLVVVGVAAQEEKDLLDFTAAKLEFPLAVDPERKLAAAAGVTSVPQAVFMDAKGIVRYAGHPAALDASFLKRLLARPTE